MAEEEVPSGRFVVTPGGIKFNRDQDLPGIMQDDAYPNELLIDGHAQVNESSEEKFTRFANKGDMPE